MAVLVVKKNVVEVELPDGVRRGRIRYQRLWLACWSRNGCRDWPSGGQQAHLRFRMTTARSEQIALHR
jgi:hypothetical protein